MIDKKVVVCGGAGLVGQNLVARLRAEGYSSIVVLDKHRKNLEILSSVQPEVDTEFADLAEPGQWSALFNGAQAVVMLQAQIGGMREEDFTRNNIAATENVLSAMREHNTPWLIHVSSSVVESQADDFYTRSKTAQEKIVDASGIAHVILRPTLMFGWFDRKHLGWLSRFMKTMPVFPIPGHGRYTRQPLYAGDFSDIIIRCLEQPDIRGTFNISGQERIDYIDIIRSIKRVTGTRCFILKLPYSVFFALLWVWALFDKDPPFTIHQLRALVIKEEFEIIDWPSIFNVRATPFEEAAKETFDHPEYSKITLEF